MERIPAAAFTRRRFLKRSSVIGALAVSNVHIYADELIQPDEEIQVFPSFAHRNADDTGWSGSIHGWIYKTKVSDFAQRAVQATIGRLAGQTRLTGIDNERRLHDRVQKFLLQSGQLKRYRAAIGTHELQLRPNGTDGHFHGRFEIRDQDPLLKDSNDQIRLQVTSSADQILERTIELVPARGLSVICDIDDTLRITDVRNVQRAVSRTFLEEYEAVPGMAEFAKELERKQAAFHYVSAAPWQLFPLYEEFLKASGYPSGEWSMREFRVREQSLTEMFKTPDAVKIPAIEEILRRYPGRRFLLIGDSGEHDPEIYGDIARNWPDNILGILIRNVDESNSANHRFASAFRNIPAERWTLFHDPAELPVLVNRWTSEDRGNVGDHCV